MNQTSIDFVEGGHVLYTLELGKLSFWERIDNCIEMLLFGKMRIRGGRWSLQSYPENLFNICGEEYAKQQVEAYKYLLAVADHKKKTKNK